MTDYFALLEEARRPWLDTDSLKHKFLARSAEVHPDRVHNAAADIKAAAQQRYAELNAAYLCLREPRDRLRHLLELELGRKPGELQEMPPELADLFMQIVPVLREADGFLARYAATTSPLLRAQSFGEVQQFTERLTARQHSLKEHHDQLLRRLEELDRTWCERTADLGRRTDLLPELENICRRLGFFSRWNGQLQERLLRLML